MNGEVNNVLILLDRR